MVVNRIKALLKMVDFILLITFGVLRLTGAFRGRKTIQIMENGLVLIMICYSYKNELGDIQLCRRFRTHNRCSKNYVMTLSYRDENSTICL